VNIILKTHIIFSEVGYRCINSPLSSPKPPYSCPVFCNPQSESLPYKNTVGASRVLTENFVAGDDDNRKISGRI